MHSSRKRTVRCSSRLLGGGDVCPGGVCPGGVCLGEGDCLEGVSAGHSPPVDRILETCLWKHYLPQLLLRTVMMSLHAGRWKYIQKWSKNKGQSSKKFFAFACEWGQRVSSIVRDKTLYLTMLSAVTPTQWGFYIISVLPHIHIFTDVSMFGMFLTLYRNLGITKSSLCCRIDSKLQFSGSYVKISWEMASEIS